MLPLFFNHEGSNLDKAVTPKVDPAVLQRLRAERDASAQRQAELGVTAGRDWACQADYEQLDAVAILTEIEWDDADVFGCLLDAVYGFGEYSPAEGDRFGEQWLNRAHPSPNAVRGFISGAAEIYELI